MTKARETLVNIDNLVGERSNTRHKLDKALDDVSAAAESLGELLDYLERHPEALIQGKGDNG